LSAPGRSIAVARIVKTQGRRGEVAAEILTDFPQRFEQLRSVLLEGPEGSTESVELENAWLHKRQVVLKFAGVDSISGAERLRGKHVLIPESQRVRLPAGTFYVWELAGCRVLRKTEAGGEVVGKVTEVEPTGGVALLHVEQSEGAKRELLIPLAAEICRRIDTEAREIWIEPPEDLLDLNS
jgi:16S rRNA processing protein RimM